MNKKTNKIPSEFNFDSAKTNFNSLSFKKDDFVYRHGGLPKGLYYIKSGKIEITKEMESGKKLSLRIAKSGEFIGYKDLILKSRYSSNAVAKEDSVLYFIKKKDFNNMLQSIDISNYFLDLTSTDFSVLENDFVSMAGSKSVEDNAPKESMSRDKITLSVDELLELLGSSVETFIKILSGLNNENVLSVKGRILSMQEDNRLAVIRHIQNQILTRTEH